ncbi:MULTISPECIES: hypothetical protein [Streptomyces rochei group]|uniref:hypothetical protein n=1 Tax=Streptomyces rochei group TaxID=2867164 RepID=UPI001876434F|nr:hypothetical protein [Streptomyces vinaceusdrappus]GHC36711.1 hypothetical protein GCM10010308_63960 [Streptomyces vinaceusdrappus]
MIQPDGDDYYVTTNVYRRGTLDWAWEVTLRQPWPRLRTELDDDYGSRMTEKAAKRKADRVAQRMMRAAASWTSRTYEAEESRP